jgi:hypothetical protein
MTIRRIVAACALLTILAASAQAQAPFVNKPIDTEKFVIRPTNVVANTTAGTTSTGIRAIGSTIANTIENNGFVRTFNNVFGRRATPVTSQAGYSALPLTSSFQSTLYPNSFTPRMPVNSTFGRTPNVTRN